MASCLIINHLSMCYSQINRIKQELFSTTRVKVPYNVISSVINIIGLCYAFNSSRSVKYYIGCQRRPYNIDSEARKRSYLVGSVGPTSLLGTQELERQFPDRTIR